MHRLRRSVTTSSIPHHGAGQVIKKEEKDILGEKRQYLTIKILHNDMTVMVPCENAGKAGLRRVIDEETVKKVLAVLSDDVSEMPKNWNRRFKHNRDKIKTGDIYELAEVVRNLAIREQDKGLSTGEKQMYTRAKKILASELMYALEKGEERGRGAPRRRSSSAPARTKLGAASASVRGDSEHGGRPPGGRRAVANALGPTGPRRSSCSPAARCSSGASPPCGRRGSSEIVVALPPGEARARRAASASRAARRARRPCARAGRGAAPTSGSSSTTRRGRSCARSSSRDALAALADADARDRRRAA